MAFLKPVVAIGGAALVACLLAFVTASEPARATAIPGENGGIVYSGEDNSDTEIYIISPSGGTPTKVTNNTRNEYDPSVSSDGQKIAYLGRDVQDYNYSDEIYIISPSGGTPTKVTNDSGLNVYDPSISSDGQKIVYVGQELQGVYNDEIYTIPSKGGTPTKVTDREVHDSGFTMSEHSPSFSPDGQTIAYVGWGLNSNSSEIYTIPSSGGTPSPRGVYPITGGYSPSFSPDGQKIAFAGSDGHDYEIYTMPSSGGTPTNVTNNTTSEVQPAFSPDGQKIAFAGWDGHDYEIYTIPSSGGTPIQLTDNRTNDRSPSWGGYLPDPTPPETTPPETTMDSGPDGLTNDSTPTFSFSGSDNESAAANLLFSYKVDNEAWSEYSYQTTVTLGGETGLPYGSHTFYVKAKDQAGNVDESPAERAFEVVDATPPTVASVKPSDGKTGVRRGTNITATFLEDDINPDTLDGSGMVLYKMRSGSKVDAAVKYDQASKTVILDPSVKLARNTKYKAVITTAVTDKVGNHLEVQKEWVFTTGRR